MKRVVITGIGAITPLATSFAHSWEKIAAGISGIGPLTRVNPDVLVRKRSCMAAGEISGLPPGLLFSKKESNHIDPFVEYAVFAAREAVENAGLLSYDYRISVPCGILLGSSRGGITTLEREFAKILTAQTDGKKERRLSPFLMPSTTISAAGAYVAAKLGVIGYVLGISGACASGAHAIGEAFRMIRYGGPSVLIAGGTEAPICRLCMEGYGSAGVLSGSAPDEASRPFDVKRNGFVLSEGSCLMVLEDMEHAISRNAPIMAEIIGYGNVCDAASLTLPSVEGESLAISNALEDARICVDEVDYINTHGTSTRAGDKAEAGAIRKIFRDRPVPVNAIKSMTGHMLAASGAFETACTAMSLQEGLIPPTINTCDVDPECPVNLVKEAFEIPIRTAITNSFGFGGVNAALVLRRFEP